jgi:sugar phosphate isomerase/epimerase
MHLGLMTSVFQDRPLDQALAAAKRAGITTVELGTGGYPGDRHCQPLELLASGRAFSTFSATLQNEGMSISALACHGNPLHPDERAATRDHRVFEGAVLLAERLGVRRLTLFSGCPGDSPSSSLPNWVTCAWPTDYLRILEWQWTERVIPYWEKQAAFAREHGVDRLCFEMHPGFVVYNPSTLLRLRDAVGPVIGANLDPSHLMWQGMDVIEVVRLLGAADAIFHVHAKDTALNARNIALNGVLDTVPLDEVGRRSWLFRTVGYGHDLLYWKTFVSALLEVGYDDVLSIEHEDVLAAPEEGVQKAADLLRAAMFVDAPAKPWWTA